MKHIGLSCGIILIGGTMAWAAQAPRFNYQAKLSDASAAPLNGAHTLHFRIYRGGDAVTADSGVLAFEEDAAVTAANGVVNHTVGTGTAQSPGPLTASILRTNQNVFLQVSVDNVANVILPRTRLESVPYAILSADGDARVPISQPNAFPILIDAPGSYYLTENIRCDTNIDGIQITTSGVTLDLGGFLMTGTGASDIGVAVFSPAANVEIRNGAVTNWEYGINALTGEGVRVHNIRAYGNGASGISVGNNSIVENCIAERNSAAFVSGIHAGYGSIIRHCVASNNSVTGSFGICAGIECYSGCLITECVCNANEGRGNGDGYGISCLDNCRVLNNECFDNITTGTGAGRCHGIDAGSECNISGNTCSFNSASQTNGSAAGIAAESESVVRDNVCAENKGQGTGRSAGIIATGRCRVENNHCSSHYGTTARNFGLVLNSSNIGSAFIKNTTANNGTAGLRLENTSGSSYYAENIFDETTSVSQAIGGTNVAGTGDRSNVAF